MNSKQALTRSELRFWQAAFLAAELSVLLEKGLLTNPQAAAHIASEYATAAVNELRAAKSGS